MRVGLGVLLPVGIFAVLIYAIVSHSGDLHRAAAHSPGHVLVLASALGLLTLLARSEIAVACLTAMGDRPNRLHIHAASAVGFVVSTLNHFIVSPVRAALLRRLDRQRAPTVPQMILVDASAYAIEGLLAAAILIATAGTLHLQWWMPVLAVAGALTTVAVAVKLHTSLRQHPMFHGLAMLTSPRSRAIAGGLTAAIFAFQILRTLIVLHAVGLHPTLLDAAATYVAGGVLSALLAGPAAGTAAAPLVVFGSRGLGAPALAGVMLAGTALIAAVLYTVLLSPVLVRRPSMPTSVAPSE
jgi:uncharacterized membrane protein YbhN (UPF0104 family)